MKKRSIVKLENFLFVSSATIGVSVLVFVCGFAAPVVSAIKTRRIIKNTTEGFCETFPYVYCDDIQTLTSVPFSAYQAFKRCGAQRLKKFDSKQK